MKASLIVLALAAVAGGVYWFVIRPRRQLAAQAETSNAILERGYAAVLGPSLAVLKPAPLLVSDESKASVRSVLGMAPMGLLGTSLAPSEMPMIASHAPLGLSGLGLSRVQSALR